MHDNAAPPPTRVSLEDSDPSFRYSVDLRNNGYVIEVYLNGKIQLNAITADSKTGFVKRFKLNEYREPFLDGE